MNASIQASAIASAMPISHPRTFAPGQYVRVVSDNETNGEVGLVFDAYDDGIYLVSLFDDEDTEALYSANGLIPWQPKVGDRVIEAGVEGEEVGVIVANDGITSHVHWKTLVDAPYWPNIRLEPAEPMTA